MKKLGNMQKMCGKFFHLFVELDKEKKADGCDLDEHTSHVFLERIGKTLTVIKMREEFRKIDANFDKKMAMIEFLIWNFKIDIDDLLSRPQGSSVEVAEAEKALEAVSAELRAIETKKAELRAIIEKEGAGVKGGKAAGELLQLENQDPINLNKAVITAEAALRKAQKAGNPPLGQIWWMQREVAEAKAYMPKHKQ